MTSLVLFLNQNGPQRANELFDSFDRGMNQRHATDSEFDCDIVDFDDTSNIASENESLH